MIAGEYDKLIEKTLNTALKALEDHFEADVIFFYGAIYNQRTNNFRDFIELLKDDPKTKNRLVIFLNTDGGEVEVVESFVDIIRYHYKEVYFIVPDYAMSAGTIFCMSGDKIFMDYTSSLGPIDPQVYNGKDFVPALGYLDQVERMLEKAKNNELTNAEFVILQSQDLAVLSRYEQAKNLTVTLLKNWLVEYKFKDWKKHETNPEKIGQDVTRKEKEERAEEIATLLGNNQLWHSHRRKINIHALKNQLKLKIEDYSDEKDLGKKIRFYNDVLVQYILRQGHSIFLHSRVYFL